MSEQVGRARGRARGRGRASTAEAPGPASANIPGPQGAWAKRPGPPAQQAPSYAQPGPSGVVQTAQPPPPGVSLPLLSYN